MGTSFRGPRKRRTSILITIVAIALIPSSGNAAKAEVSRDAVERMSAIADASRPVAAAELHLKRDGEGNLTPASDPTRDRLESTFETPSDFGDPANYVSAARTLLESMRGERVTSVRNQVDAAGDARGTSVVAADSHLETDYIGLPGGDLDGDGVDDVLSFEISYDPSSYEDITLDVRGTRGTDGSSLWTRALGSYWDVIPIPVDDMTGDGKADLLTWEFTFNDVTTVGSCAVVACAVGYSYSYRWNIRLLSGADGSQVWVKPFDGEATQGLALASGIAAFAYLVPFTATNALVLPIPSGDHDGDGAADLVIDALDVTELFAVGGAGIFVGGYAYAVPQFSATDASLISGDDGATLFSRSVDEHPGVAVLEPAGNALGDATTDLMWQTVTYPTPAIACVYALLVGTCASTERATHDIEMIDGALLEPVWSTTTINPTSEYLFVTAARADLDGDGSDDLLLHDYTTLGVDLAAISGSDGEGLWRIRRPAYSGYAVLGPVGGAAGADVLIAGFDWTWDAAIATLDRIDGGTGDLLLSTVDMVTADNGYADLYVYVMGDADGDGARDLVVESVVVEFEPYQVEGLVRAESAVTGATLASHPNDGTSWTFGVTDLTGDGNADLLDLGQRMRRTGLEITTSVIAMPGGTTAWSRADRFFPDVYLSIRLSPDLSGLGGDDLLGTEWQFTDESQSRIHVVEGTTGVSSWTHGDVFTPTPTPGTASFSGLVLDEDGNPLEGICVTPFTLAGDAMLGERTAADGTYTVDELGAGSYRALFTDCSGLQLYSSQWFDGADSFLTADDIVVSEGSDTTGVDAVLAALPGPVNDLIADAITIDSLPYQDSRTTVGASTEPGEAAPCAGIGSTVWYRHTPAADGLLTISTDGSGYDTALAAYEGETGPDLFLQCDDDGGPDLTSRLEVSATAGTTYWIQAGGFAGDQGMLLLSVS